MQLLSSSGRMNPFDGDDYYAVSGGEKVKGGNPSLSSNQQQDDHKTGNGNSNPFDDSDDESFQQADGTSVEHEHHDELTSTSSNLMSDGRNNLSECNSEDDECKEQHLPNQPQSQLADDDNNPFNDIERGGDVASSVTTDTSSQISSHQNTDASHDQSHEIDDDASHSRAVASRSQSDNSEDNYSDKVDIEEAMGDVNGDKETEKHDMPQSSLFRDDITGDANSSSFSDDTNQNEATTPLLQQHDEAESYWNKEDIGDAVSAFNERAKEYETKTEDVDNPKNESYSSAGEQLIVRRSSIPRKKVRNRYCKACVMVTVVWSAMVILVAVALGMDWLGINESLDQTKSESLCTLCAANGGIGFNFSAYTLRPTRKPSTSIPPASIRPPPESLAEICAPSIFLDHGPKSETTRDHLVASCATACLPAACCVIDNAEARQSLITMLELQGFGAQAAAFLSTTKNCNVGKNVNVCNSYNTFCSTLYDLEYALKQLPQNMQHMCSNDLAEDTTSISTAYSRQYNLPTKSTEKCKDACLPLACCYESIIEPAPVSRKRKRQPTHALRRNTQKTRSCSGFNASNGSVNADICHAYAPFCGSFDSSSKPSSSPTTFTMPTSTPSPVPSSVPSSVPPSRLPTVPYSTTLVNTARPSSNTTNSGLPVIISNTTQPSLIPSLISTTDNSSSAVPQPSNAPTNSYHPTINSSSSFVNSSLSSVVPSLNSTTESSFISTLIPTPNVTSQPSNRPTNSFYPTLNPSSSVINIISSPPSNNAASALTPTQYPTISALPSREANYTHNASITT